LARGLIALCNGIAILWMLLNREIGIAAEAGHDRSKLVIECST
jgi:hypothetical protein